MKRTYILTASMLMIVFAALPAHHYSQKGNTLFSFKEQPSQAADEKRSSIASVREAAISFNFTGTESSQFLAQRFEIPLFDDKTYEAIRTDLEVRDSNDLVWRGKLKDKVESDVILTFKNGYVAGIIQTSGNSYEIIPRGNEHILIELDDRKFPECSGSTIANNEDSKPITNALNLAPESTTDSGDRIDVLVVYTTSTKNFLGGTAQADAFAQSAIDSSNTAYINSGIRQRVRLVHAAEHVIVESGNSSTDLTNLRANATIQALRNTHNADLVALLLENSEACGRAYLVGSPGGQASGYSITTRSCAIGNLSFVHELGHNMGSNHNPEDSGSGQFAPYSFGHWVNGSFRTIMSYVNQCPQGCTRRPIFSGPGIFFNGIPAGIHDQRDNVRSINETAINVANYRYSGSSITLNSFKTGGILHRNLARRINWTTTGITGNVRIQVSRDEGRTWQTVFNNVPNTGAANITVQGKNTKRGRVRVMSIDSPHVSDSSVRDIFIK